MHVSKNLPNDKLDNIEKKKKKKKKKEGGRKGRKEGIWSFYAQSTVTVISEKKKKT